MAKFKLAVDPTFKHVVQIRVAGSDEPQELEMTFKHHTITELAEEEERARTVQQEARDEANKVGEYESMAAFIMFIAKSWELPQPFNEENLIIAMTCYPRFFEDVVGGYTRELWCLRQKP